MASGVSVSCLVLKDSNADPNPGLKVCYSAQPLQQITDICFIGKFILICSKSPLPTSKQMFVRLFDPQNFSKDLYENKFSFQFATYSNCFATVDNLVFYLSEKGLEYMFVCKKESVEYQNQVRWGLRMEELSQDYVISALTHSEKEGSYSLNVVRAQGFSTSNPSYEIYSIVRMNQGLNRYILADGKITQTHSRFLATPLFQHYTQATDGTWLFTSGYNGQGDTNMLVCFNCADLQPVEYIIFKQGSSWLQFLKIARKPTDLDQTYWLVGSISSSVLIFNFNPTSKSLRLVSEQTFGPNKLFSCIIDPTDDPKRLILYGRSVQAVSKPLNLSF